MMPFILFAFSDLRPAGIAHWAAMSTITYEKIELTEACTADD